MPYSVLFRVVKGILFFMNVSQLIGSRDSLLKKLREATKSNEIAFFHEAIGYIEGKISEDREDLMAKAIYGDGQTTCEGCGVNDVAVRFESPFEKNSKIRRHRKNMIALCNGCYKDYLDQKEKAKENG